jgi:DNA-binding NtrC family response regulator
VKSEVGRGTVFSIYFPSLDVREEENAAPMETLDEGRRARLLLVEDEECLRRPLAVGLRRSGYTVLEAAGGPQALELDDLHEGPIDLVITDVLMPAMSGRDLANELRVRRPGLKVLYMSGHAAEEMVNQGVLDEGVDLLYKPFTIQKLVSKVAQVLNKEDGGSKPDNGASVFIF